MNKNFNKILNFAEKILPLKSEKLFAIRTQKPLISFSFDDFPLSAAHTGAEIMQKFNIKGTYFVSLGRLGQDSKVGKICDIDTIKKLIEEKHEIGNHTYNHSNGYEVSLEDYEQSVINNVAKFRELFITEDFETFSYPFGIASNRIQSIVRRYSRCARTTNRGINFGNIDVHLLKAFSLYGHGEEFGLIKSAIQFTISKNGWLNLYTHDISANPSLFGCTPEYFEKVVEYSVNSGAIIVPLKEACDILQIYKK